MERIMLKDNTEFEIKAGATLRETTVVVEDFAALQKVAESLTKEGNLDLVKYKNGMQVTSTYQDMKLEAPLFKDVTYTEKQKVAAAFGIREKTEMEKRMDAVEKEMREFKGGQEIQDGAIADLGNIVSGMVEGGTV